MRREQSIRPLKGSQGDKPWVVSIPIPSNKMLSERIAPARRFHATLLDVWPHPSEIDPSMRLCLTYFGPGMYIVYARS